MAKISLYPPGPVDVPDDLTQVTAEYKSQTFFVLLSLGLFFFLYLGLMFGCFAFLIWAFFFATIDPRRGNVGFIMFCRFILGVPALMLLVYMVKNLLKFERPNKNWYIEITEDEHPKLFDFIDRICEETGAKLPNKVYVDFTVNAAAISSTSFFHLFIPTSKDLLLGLGLVNAINLTEFKALLAHEFGHFSQKGSKIGSYVYQSMRIVDNIVYGEDWFDRFINGWCRLDIRISFVAWIFWGILWCLRHILIGLRFTIAYFKLALSRQMEFNADLVAVSLAGSDAPVHLLHKSIFADECFTQTVEDLKIAMDHHLYTSDLFFHQSRAAEYLRLRRKDPTLGIPPALPANPTKTTQVFKDEDNRLAEMWSTHPSNFDREENAKEYYIRTEFDERSPWLLFDQVAELREKVTYKFYRFFFKISKDVILADPEEIQGFIDDERSETTYDAKYQGLYDSRNLLLPDVYELAQEAKRLPLSVAQLLDTQKNLYRAEVKHKAQLYGKRIEERRVLSAIVQRRYMPPNEEIEFRGEIYDLDEAKSLLKKVEKELKNDNKWLGELDKQVFLTHFQMALQISQEVAEDLFKRYRFHMELQNVWWDLTNSDGAIDEALYILRSAQAGSLPADQFREALGLFRDAYKLLKESLKVTEELILPPLKNLQAGQPVRDFLLEKKLVEGLSKYDNSISGKWLDKFFRQLEEVKKKINRIHFKSLGGILALQEKTAAECQRRWSGVPAGLPAVVPLE
jgi:Zn-dependent protease with chaperone function